MACKVTPLADGVPDLNSRYPYGAEDHTDVRYIFIHLMPNIQRAPETAQHIKLLFSSSSLSLELRFNQ